MSAATLSWLIRKVRNIIDLMVYIYGWDVCAEKKLRKNRYLENEKVQVFCLIWASANDEMV